MDTVISVAFYALAGLLAATLLVTLFQTMGLRQKKQSLLNVEVELDECIDEDIDEDVDKEPVKERKFFNPFSHLRKSLDRMYFYNPNGKLKDKMFGIILGVEGLFFITLMLLQKYFVAVLFVVIIHLIVLKLIQIKTTTLKDYVQTDLPIAIKHVIKVLTKTNDLKTVFLDASKGMKEPLRSHFVEMARLMISGSHQKALLKFADDSNSIWAYSFAYIMSSYKDSSKKVEIIRNLALLAEMMETENRNAEKALTERKPLIVLNNMLVVLALLTFAGNLWKNTYALTFFFETPGGVMALIAGFTFLGITFIINFVIGQRRY